MDHFSDTPSSAGHPLPRGPPIGARHAGPALEGGREGAQGVAALGKQGTELGAEEGGRLE